VLKIVRAGVMGYCMGVQRAIYLAERALQSSRTVYALGSIIHNAKEIERLATLGMVVVDEDATLNKGSTVLIRAHGLHPLRHQELRKQGLILIDATCPLVVKNQHAVSEADDANLTVIIVGKPEHAEIKALCGFARKTVIVSDVAEAQALNLPDSRVFIIAQTTLRPALYQDIRAILAHKFTLVEKGKSICPATQDRQDSIKILAKQVEAIVIVGDKNSANTQGLLDTVLHLGLPGYLVTGKDDIPYEMLSQWQVVGLSAGASAPEWLIDEVELALLAIK
jgi:4-hydroxy-3-methylbut-2-enyl diphosphate reductase